VRKGGWVGMNLDDVPNYIGSLVYLILDKFHSSSQILVK